MITTEHLVVTGLVGAVLMGAGCGTRVTAETPFGQRFAYAFLGAGSLLVGTVIIRIMLTMVLGT